MKLNNKGGAMLKSIKTFFSKDNSDPVTSKRYQILRTFIITFVAHFVIAAYVIKQEAPSEPTAAIVESNDPRVQARKFEYSCSLKSVPVISNTLGDRIFLGCKDGSCKMEKSSGTPKVCSM